MEHGARKHKRYSASTAHRGMKCPASWKLASTVPSYESPYAQDGTEAHELVDFALKNGLRDAREAHSSFFPHWWTYRHDSEQERLDSVQDMLDYVYEILDAYEGSAVLYNERDVTLPSFVTDEGGGWMDVGIHVPDFGLLYVIDYKHGAGYAVDAEENEQGMSYAGGLIDELPEGTVSTVNIVIVQPRAFHPQGPVRVWTTTPERIETFIHEFDAAVLLAERADAPFVPGEDQCRYCPVKRALACPAVETQAVQVINEQFRSVRDIVAEKLPDPASLPVDRLAYILQAEELVSGFFKECRETAEEHLRSGGFVPGFKMVEAQARRRWYGDDETNARSLMALIGTDDWDEVYPRKLLTITEAERKVKEAFKAKAGRGKKKAAAEDATQAMAALTVKESSGNLTMVRDTDPRPPANITQQAFANVRQIEAKS